MATTIPDALKSADITRFVNRAVQVEKAKPAVAYWCYYWIVQQIVTRGLHNTSQDAMEYTVQLMDKLETAKATDNDAIKDEVAAQALIEQFGLDVFSRADNTVRANKASRQTADTFQAAYTFLELLQIWPPLDQQIAAKIKYAKYHALRIAKAVKSGEDPNLSNPVLEPEPDSSEVAMLDPNDPEVRAIQGDTSESDPGQANHTAVTHNIVHTSAVSPYDTSGEHADNHLTKHPESPSTFKHAENYYQTSKDVSPIEPPSNRGPPSIGGGYFPRTSDGPQVSPGFGPATLPSAPADLPDSPLNMSPIDPVTGPHYGNSAPPAPFEVPHVSHVPVATSPYPTSTAVNQPRTTAVQSMVVVDDQAMIEAQKRAKWAISALNFEDVPTAIDELRKALELLGARGPW